jgi:hypothetical protein
MGIGFWAVFSAMESSAATPDLAGSNIEDSAEVFDRSDAHTLYLSGSVNEGVASLASAGSSILGSGTQTELLGLATLKLDYWIIEAGGGWLSSSLSGGTSNVPNSTLALSSYSMTTEAGVAELSPQYRLTEHLQAGPVGEMLFGSNVGFDYNLGGPLQEMALMGGAQALYEFRVGPMDLRAGARYLTNLNIPNQRLQTVQATLQFGLPVL